MRVVCCTPTRGQAWLFVVSESHTFIRMVGQRGQHKGRLLANRQHPSSLGTDGHTSPRVGVQHANSVMTRLMHGAVNHKTGRVDGKG